MSSTLTRAAVDRGAPAPISPREPSVHASGASGASDRPRRPRPSAARASPRLWAALLGPLREIRRRSLARAALRCWSFALLVGMVAACAGRLGDRSVHAPEAADQAATPGLFLYELRSRHSSAHLLGTIHVGFGFDEVLTAGARQRFEAAERVITEADISSANPEHLIQAALLPPERSLRSLLGERTWNELLARIGGQIPAAMLDRLEPWLPAVMLGLEDLERALREVKPGSESRLMDIELMRRAHELGKTLAHLETVEQQIAIFDSISLEEQVRELARSLETDSGAQARALLSSFASGDEAALTRALFDEAQLASAPGFYQRVLFERNAQWLPVIERELGRGGAFIAVGAAHLLGERGIVAELRRRGYRVTRVAE